MKYNIGNERCRPFLISDLPDSIATFLITDFLKNLSAQMDNMCKTA